MGRNVILLAWSLNRNLLIVNEMHLMHPPIKNILKELSEYQHNCSLPEENCHSYTAVLVMPHSFSSSVFHSPHGMQRSSSICPAIFAAEKTMKILDHDIVEP